MFTQLRPGKDDYQLWMKIKEPAGSGKYERWDMEIIDPDFTAPELDVRFPKPKPFRKVLEAAAETSRETLERMNETLENEEGTEEGENQEEDAEGFVEVTHKISRSSPGEENEKKKNRYENREKQEDFYRNVLKKQWS